MGRKGLTYQDVAQVADALISEQQEPTTTAVRKKIGCGSNTTIGLHLREWRARKAKEELPHVESRLPEDIANTVSAHINKQILLIQQSTDERLAQEQRATAVAEEEVDRLLTELESAQMRITELESNLAENTGRLKQSLEHSQETLRTLEEKLNAVDQRAVEAEKNAAVASVKLEASVIRMEEAVKREKEAQDALQALLANQKR